MYARTSRSISRLFFLSAISISVSCGGGSDGANRNALPELAMTPTAASVNADHDTTRRIILKATNFLFTTTDTQFSFDTNLGRGLKIALGGGLQIDSGDPTLARVTFAITPQAFVGTHEVRVRTAGTEFIFPFEISRESAPQAHLVLSQASGSLMVDPCSSNCAVSLPTPNPLRNSGNLAASWQVTAHPTWLTFTPDSGTLAPGATQPITISIDPANLADNQTFTGSVEIDTQELSNGPITYTFTLTVNPRPAEITVGPNFTESTFQCLTAPCPTIDKTVTLSNTGGRPLHYRATWSAAWLRLNQSGANVTEITGDVDPESSTSLPISFDPTGLPATTQNRFLTDTITFSEQNQDPQVPSQTIQISLTILDPSPPQLQVTKSINVPWTFTEKYCEDSGSGGELAALAPDCNRSVGVEIKNIGGQTLQPTVSLQNNPANLTASYSPGSVNLGKDATASITITLNFSHLAIGTYHANVVFSDPDASNSPVSFTLDLTIQ